MLIDSIPDNVYSFWKPFIIRCDTSNDYDEVEKIMDGVDSERMVSYLYSLNRKGPKLGLERVADLLKRLDEPQKSFTPILVGGTNGKGSTAAILSSILRMAGYRVGAYTSPHLTNITERIAFQGMPIPEDALFGIVERIRTAAEGMEKEGKDPPTFFETMTTAAFIYFKEMECDFAVLEVGMGGRLDATNVTEPPVSIITNISLEHTKILGDTKVKIAGEKAGIIKKGGLLITATKDDEVFAVFQKTCEERGSRITRIGRETTYEKKTGGDDAGEGRGGDSDSQSFDISLTSAFGSDLENREIISFADLRLHLLGDHQLDNASCAIGAVLELEKLGFKKITERAIRQGLENVVWPGRFEIMRQEPLVVLDCAKDLEAMKALRGNIERYTAMGRGAQNDEGRGRRKLVLVISISSDKDHQGMLDTIIPISDEIIATEHAVRNRALDPGIIAQRCKALSKKYLIIRDVKQATEKAMELAGSGGIVLVTGSVFTVGEAREIWHCTEGKNLGRELNEAPAP